MKFEVDDSGLGIEGQNILHVERVVHKMSDPCQVRNW